MHFVTEGVDEGPVIIQMVVPVLDGDTEETLSSRILEKEHEALPKALQWFAKGRLIRDGRRVSVISSGDPGSKKPEKTSLS